MTIFAADSNARTFDYQGGDVGYVPAGFGTSTRIDGTAVPPRRLSFILSMQVITLRILATRLSTFSKSSTQVSIHTTCL
jgi:hypothetical protein